MEPESLYKAIQLSEASVFLLASIRALMNVISGRLVRIVDNARKTKAALDAGETIDEQEQVVYCSRMQLTIHAIELLTAATLLISTVVAGMFFGVISRINLTLVVLPLFITAMVLVMLASIYFLRGVLMASAHVIRLF
tara:strand:+ start:121 stop:534 length:414 start_codon:yes stop_codon:yes gene_type:complete